MAFNYYSPVTINSGQVPSTQTDFPVLISLTDTRLKTVANGGHVNHSGGFDIRPYSDGPPVTAITGYELVYYSPTTGTIEMWVKRSSVADGLVTYLAYGDPGITTDGSSTTTWSNSFQNVYHLKDGSTLGVSDSTGNFNGTNHGATAATGQIDGGAGFASASSQYISTSSTVVTAVTFSAWVNATSFPNAYNSVIYRNSNNSDANGILVKSTGKLFVQIIASSARSYDGTGSHTLTTGSWFLLHLTYDSTSGLVAYVNGASDGTVVAAGAANMVSLVNQIGRDDVNTRYWNGSMDEVRYCSVARSQNWVTTEYNNQVSPSTFETLGTEVSLNPMAGLFTK